MTGKRLWLIFGGFLISRMLGNLAEGDYWWALFNAVCVYSILLYTRSLWEDA